MPAQSAKGSITMKNLTHLQRLEAEAIHIMREVAAEAQRTHHRRVDAHCLADRDRVARQTIAVPRRVRVARLDRQGERRDDALRALELIDLHGSEFFSPE